MFLGEGDKDACAGETHVIPGKKKGNKDDPGFETHSIVYKVFISL
jgi:hypothetical protein